MEEEPLARLCSAGIMVVDDITTPRTGFEMSLLDELLTRRHTRGGYTVLTSNLNSFRELGERLDSRLGAATRVPILGEDRRRRAA